MPTSFDDGRYHDLEQGIESGNRIFGGVRLGEQREVADVDEYHCHPAAFPGEHLVTLLEQPPSEGRADISAERSLKSLPPQPNLPPVERRRQRPRIISA